MNRSLLFRHFVITGALAMLAFAGAKPLCAATIAVTSSADPGGTCPGANCTLRRAIAAAAPGDTIRFQIPTTDAGYNSARQTWTITLSSPSASDQYSVFVLDKNLTIDGGGQKIVLKGVPSGQGFHIIDVISGTIRISGLTITGGYVIDNGTETTGAIRNLATLTLSGCTITGNTAGAGIRNGGTLNLVNCTVTKNSGDEGAGGVDNTGQLSCTSSTIVANSGQFAAGGINNRNGGTARVSNCAIAGNTAYNFNGGAGGPFPADVSGSFTSDGFNFIGVIDGSMGFGGSHDQVGTQSAPANPKLSPLADHGGGTMTMYPLNGSPLIDQGNSGGVTTDQRGDRRSVNLGVSSTVPGDYGDIGAVEVDLISYTRSKILTVTNTDEHDDVDCTVDDCSLASAIQISNSFGKFADLGPYTIRFAPGLAGEILNTKFPTGLSITTPVTIEGPGARVLAISGNDVARVFNITSAGVVNISGLTIKNGSSGSGVSGGGIANTAILNLSNCNLFSNSGGSGGGALNSGTLNVTNCSFIGNTSTGNGGALRNVGAMTLTNSTFYANFGATSGAIASFTNDGSSASVSLTNCTISNNVATNSGSLGGGLYNGTGTSASGSTMTVLNTIVTNNSAASAPDVSGIFSSQGYNYIGSKAGSFGFDSSADHEGDPQLDTALKNNGGPTDTLALLPGSKAINAGNVNAPPKDQRGAPRVDIPDIGAFEFGGSPPPPATVTTNVATNVGATSATLNAIVNPNGLPTSFQFTSDFRSFPVQDAGSGATNVSFSVDVTGLIPNTQYHFKAVVMSNGVTIQGAEQVFTTLPPSLVGNVSTRLPVGTGDNVLIEGFIVQGPVGSTKKIIVRAVGPSLAPFGITDALANPTLEIHDAGNATIATNDDWRTTQVGGIIKGDQSAEISASSLAPSNDRESAIIANLSPGSYTAVVRGVGNTVGTGVVDAYDLSTGSSAKLANVATRGLIQPGDKLMIAGFIIQNGPVKAVVRAIGPSLVAFGVNNALADTTLQIRDMNGAIVVENDNWKVRSDGSSQQAELEATGLQPTNDLEAAVLTTLPPGQYSAQVRGKPETTGIGVVQVYFLQ